MHLLLKLALPLSVNLNCYATKVATHIKFQPYPLHTIKFIPDSDMLFPYSYQNSIP